VSVVKDYKPAVICARSGDVSVRVSTFWICLCQDQLTEHDPVNWLYSVLCINNSATFHQLSNVLLVCDGDIDLTGVGGSPGTCSMSVVIANGDVSLSEGYEVRSSSVIYAAGDVYGYKRAWASTSSILAAGKNNTLPEADDPMAKQYKAYIEKYHKQGVKENPFGVKFVSPADAGVELDVGDKVVRLGKLADTSPLAKAGLQKGDRLLTQNGVRMETAADFRRQLRESLLWGTGLFEIRRGNEEFFRLVKFAEPPRK
jgi:hypothetical protein